MTGVRRSVVDVSLACLLDTFLVNKIRMNKSDLRWHPYQSQIRRRVKSAVSSCIWNLYRFPRPKLSVPPFSTSTTFHCQYSNPSALSHDTREALLHRRIPDH